MRKSFFIVFLLTIWAGDCNATMLNEIIKYENNMPKNIEFKFNQEDFLAREMSVEFCTNVNNLAHIITIELVKMNNINDKILGVHYDEQILSFVYINDPFSKNEKKHFILNELAQKISSDKPLESRILKEMSLKSVTFYGNGKDNYKKLKNSLDKKFSFKRVKNPTVEIARMKHIYSYMLSEDDLYNEEDNPVIRLIIDQNSEEFQLMITSVFGGLGDC